MPTDKVALDLSRRGALSLLLAASAAPASAAPGAAPIAFEHLASAVRRELEDKQLPSLAIGVARMAGQTWSGAWGFSDAERQHPLTSKARLRAGPLSGLIARTVLSRLADENRLDLNAPLERYLPAFAAKRAQGETITLQLLLSGGSGLPAEPPRGGGYDLSAPTLAEAVASLASAERAARPGALYRASLSDELVMARIAEIVSGESFERIAHVQALAPAGMDQASFLGRSPDTTMGLAELGSFDAARMVAPHAGAQGGPCGLVVTPSDLAALAGFLQTDIGERLLRPSGRITRREGQDILSWRGRGPAASAEIRVDRRHGVAVVVLVGLNDSASAHRLADYALESALDGGGAIASPPPRSTRLPQAEARRLSGQFRNDAETLFLRYLEGALLLEAPTMVGEVRRLGGRFVVDDAHSFEDRIEIAPDGTSVVLRGKTYARSEWPAPPPPPARLASVIGDYGWRHGYIRIYERDGAPHARLGWTRYEALAFQGEDLVIPDVPAGSPPERLAFDRDIAGKIVGLRFAGVFWPCLDLGAEILAHTRGSVSRREGLRREARLATPPREGPKAAPELIAVQSVAPSVALDIRYASDNNFMGFALYTRPGAYLQRPAASALARIALHLQSKGLGLLIHDSYRPWFVTKMFWEATPPDGRIFTADPSQGSRHNRGAAVDLTLTDLSDGAPLEMTGGYDEMTSRSYPNYVGGTSLQRWRRDTLRTAMEAEGFDVYPTEWWHFDYRGWERYPIMNRDFDEIDALSSG